MSAYYVGVDVGATNLRVVLCDEDRLRVRIKTKTITQGPPEAVAQEVCRVIEHVLAEVGIDATEVRGIGTSSGGPFVGGKSLANPNICGQDNDWALIPYVQELMKHFGADKTYQLANDCVSAVQAEYLFGAGRGHQNCVYITVSTGVGAGIIVDGHLLQGKGHNAGHFGHTIALKDGPMCNCGQRGCFEALLSGPNIARRARYAGMAVEQPKEVFDLYHAGDETAAEIIRETIEYLSILLINIINVTDTEILIIGGSVFRNNADLFLPAVQEYIAENSIVTMCEGVEFRTPALGEYVKALGGLALVIPESLQQKWVETRPWTQGVERELDLPASEFAP